MDGAAAVAKFRSFPRKRESRAISAFTRVFDALWAGSPLSRGRTEVIRRLLAAAAGADFALCKARSLCYSRTLARVVPGSSAVEQPAVNRLVAGSNPARGAKSHFWSNCAVHRVLLAPRWRWFPTTDQTVGVRLQSALRPSMSSSKLEN